MPSFRRFGRRRLVCSTHYSRVNVAKLVFDTYIYTRDIVIPLSRACCVYIYIYI